MADTEARPTTNGSNGDSGGGGADSDDEQVSVVAIPLSRTYLVFFLTKSIKEKSFY